MRVFGFVISRPTATPPADPVPGVSGFLVGESREDRLERIYCDGAELMRRAFAGLPWSRRAMRDHAMGPRRWQSAFAMLQHAAVVHQDGTLAIANQVHARRSLYACREHYAYAMRQGRYSLPF